MRSDLHRATVASVYSMQCHNSTKPTPRPLPPLAAAANAAACIIANTILIIIATTTAFDLNMPYPYSPEDTSDDAVRYWLQFAEVYQFPHVQYFTSWDHLVQLLDVADFPAIHRAMAAFNTRKRAALHKQLGAIAQGLAERGAMPQEWSQAIAPWGSTSRLFAV
jgi:hypothetical protein